MLAGSSFWCEQIFFDGRGFLIAVPADRSKLLKLYVSPIAKLGSDSRPSVSFWLQERGLLE